MLTFTHLTDEEFLRRVRVGPMSEYESELAARLERALDVLEGYGHDTGRQGQGGGEEAAEGQGHLALLPR